MHITVYISDNAQVLYNIFSDSAQVIKEFLFLKPRV